MVIPELTAAEYEALKAAIRVDGRILVPVVMTSDGEIIDGRGRLRVAEELKITDYPRDIVHGLDAEARQILRLTLNCVRRHLLTEQKREIVRAALLSMPHLSNNYIGEMSGMDGKTVAALREELESSSTIPKLTAFRGKDGKTRPRYVFTRTASETKHASEALRKMVTATLARTLAASHDGSFEDDADESEPDLGTLGTLEIGHSGVVAKARADAFRSVSTMDRNRKLLVCRSWDNRTKAALARGIAVLVLPELQEGCLP